MTAPACTVVTGATATAKATPDWPAGTVTLAGTTAAAFVSVRVTTAPPAGAGAVRLTNPLAVPQPPTTIPGSMTSDRTAGAGRGVSLTKTENESLVEFPSTTSGRPSPFTSATAMDLVSTPPEV